MIANVGSLAINIGKFRQNCLHIARALEDTTKICMLCLPIGNVFSSAHGLELLSGPEISITINLGDNIPTFGHNNALRLEF